MLHIKSIRGRLGLLFLAFVLLVSFSVGATYWNVTTQRKDALIINLAGRQRMLTQKMTWLALSQPEDPELSASITLFEQTLHALRFGGETMDSDSNLVYLPPPPDPALRNQLGKVSQTWEHFRGHLQPVDVGILPVEAPIILDQLDAVVTAFEIRAEAKYLRLALIQITFLVSAIALLAWGFIDIRRVIVKPLSELGTAVQQMGEGELDWPIPPMENNELGELAQTFDVMRAELAQSRKILESQVAQRTRELATAFEFSQEIVAQRDLNELMSSVVERARLLMQAESAAICVLSLDDNTLELASYCGDVTIELGVRKSIQDGLSQQVIGADQTIIGETKCSKCEFHLANNPGNCMVTPIRAGDYTLGAICVVQSDKEDAKKIVSFDADGQRALNLLANSAAIAISNARLVKVEHQKAKQAAAYAERELLAADLHDNLAQILSFTRIKLERLDEVLVENQYAEERVTLKQIETAIGMAYQHVRDALLGLLKPHLVSDDFAKKLAATVDDFSAANNFPVKLEIRDSSALSISHAIQTQVVQIVGEALSNVQQHSQAKGAWVAVDRVNGQARFTIGDSGIGFDPQKPMGDNHFGLQIMRTRAEKSGGEFSLSSQPGEGTRISTTFPIRKLKSA